MLGWLSGVEDPHPSPLPEGEGVGARLAALRTAPFSRMAGRSPGASQRVFALGPLLLIAVIFFGARLISGPTHYVIGLLERLITGVAMIGA